MVPFLLLDTVRLVYSSFLVTCRRSCFFVNHYFGFFEGFFKDFHPLAREGLPIIGSHSYNLPCWVASRPSQGFCAREMTCISVLSPLGIFGATGIFAGSDTLLGCWWWCLLLGNLPPGEPLREVSVDGSLLAIMSTKHRQGFFDLNTDTQLVYYTTVRNKKKEKWRKTYTFSFFYSPTSFIFGFTVITISV